MKNRTNFDVNSGVNGRPATAEEIAYRDGYVKGRATEDRQQQAHRTADRIRAEQDARTREANGTSAGLLIGLLLALLAFGTGGLIYYLTQDPEPTTTETPVERETTIIERTVENTREVVRDAPAVPDVQLPDVNIEAPDVNLGNETPVVEPDAAEPVSEAVDSAAESTTAE